MKVLIIDDDYGDFILTAEIISTHFPEAAIKNCKSAESGIEDIALVKARNSHYDLIITDLKLPRANGYNFADWAQAIFPHTPIIILTGSASMVDFKRADHLKVPILIKTIEQGDLIEYLVNMQETITN